MSEIKIDDFKRVFENREPKPIGMHHYYSVLVPLVEKKGKLHLLYEVRADNLSRQPGEICFPGGRLEADETPEECAIRETSEELNLEKSLINIISPMDYLHTYSNFTLYPYLGVIDYEHVKNVCVNQDEVKEIFLVPLSYLLKTEPELFHFDVIPNVGQDFPYEKINSKAGYNWRKGKTTVPIYQYKDKAIWGLTARITYDLMSLMKKNI